MKAAHLKVYRELKKTTPIPRAIKKQHGDIEDAIVEAGGERGKVNHA
jgi:hypothetical protein